MKFDTKINLYHPCLEGKEVISFETAPVREVSEGVFERMDIDETETPAFWSVYVRVKDNNGLNPVDCLADFPNKECAEKFEKILSKFLTNF